LADKETQNKFVFMLQRGTTMLIASLSIRAKLLVLLILPIFALAITVLLSLLELKHAHDELNEIYHSRVIPLKDLKVIADDYAVLVIDTANKLNAGLMTTNEGISNLDTASKSIQEKWLAYQQLQHSAEEDALGEQAEQLFGPANKAISEFKSFLQQSSGDLTGQLDNFDGPLYKSIDPIGEKITDLVNYQLSQTNIAVTQMDEDYENNFVVLIGSTVLLTTLLAGLGFVIYQSIRRPIEHLRSTMETISEKSNLTLTVDVTGKDELATIGHSFNKMIAQMRDLINQINKSSKHLSSSAHELNSVSKSAQKNIAFQNQEVQQVAAAMNEMASTVTDVAKSAELADLAAQDTLIKAKEGNNIVARAVNATSELIAEVRSVSEKISAVETDSNNIGSIIEVIRGIAEQTNLLALNAAIEAARAGDQGRGFAVVADEVRTLAQRTQQSTAQIQQAIERLQSGTKTAAEAMEHSRQRAEATGEQAAAAGDALSAIQQAVSSITDMNAQIASASEEQSSVADEINRSLVTINDASDASTTGTAKILHSSDELARLATDLDSLVKRFVV
jgi:methyl-accepting chemotaxis protein